MLLFYLLKHWIFYLFVWKLFYLKYISGTTGSHFKTLIFIPFTDAKEFKLSKVLGNLQVLHFPCDSCCTESWTVCMSCNIVCTCMCCYIACRQCIVIIIVTILLHSNLNPRCNFQHTRVLSKIWLIFVNIYIYMLINICARRISLQCSLKDYNIQIY